MGVDWTGDLYCGIKLYWNYDNKISVGISMKKYVLNALHEFQYPYPKRPQHAQKNGNAQTMKQ